MILMLLLPFVDRGPERRPERRPIAMVTALFVICAMGYLTYLGAAAGSPNEIDLEVAAEYEPGKLVVAQSGCLACHKIGENGNDGPGPELTDIGEQAAAGRDPAHAREPDRADAVLRGAADGEEATQLVAFLAQLKGESEPASSRRMSAGARSGTLEEGQVRAMFDRIAGPYDLMNSVMTAGLHHRWRERAADLARVGPGSRALDVATGTGDLAIELAARGATVVGVGLLGGHARASRAREGAGRSPGSRATRSRCPTRTRASTRPRSASARATSPTCRRACARWRASCGPGGRVVVLEITTPQKPPLSTFFSLWFDRIVPLLGHAGRRARGLHVPAELGEALPGAAGARRRDGRRRACATCAGSSPRAGSSPCTAGRGA